MVKLYYLNECEYNNLNILEINKIIGIELKLLENCNNDIF